MDNQFCPDCAHEMKRGVKPVTLSYKGFSTTFEMPGWYCSECGEGTHTGKDMQTSDRSLNLLKAQADHLLLPSEVRRIRKKLGLTQDGAGHLLGGGPSAFHKYENGSVLPSQAISNLLRVLDEKPDAISILGGSRTNARSASKVQRRGVRPRIATDSLRQTETIA